jgi:hypothetical protein
MAGELDKFEAMFGAIAKMTSGDESPALGNSRCPKCRASDFIQVTDLYSEAVGRIEESPESADQVRVGGMSDAQIVTKLAPPQRGSAILIPLLVAIPLGAAAFFLWRRYGDTAGQFAAIGVGVVTVGLLMTMFRKRSDDYYAARRQWRALYMCRQCGQLVAS